jgi:hypothetical protein
MIAHGVLAPNAKLRSKIVPAPAERAAAPPTDHASAQGETPRMSWARLLKRVFDIDVEHCPNCGGSLKIIAAPSTRCCYVDVKSQTHESSFFLSAASASVCFPPKERLAAMRGTAPGRHTDLQCAPLRHKAPGSLSQGSNRQEFSSPRTACRRVVPWGNVSSWVKGAD